MTTEVSSSGTPKYQRRGVQFPWKLHRLLEETETNGDSHIISWLPDGKAFKVHQKADFSKRIMPDFFNSSKHKTFQRSLNLWGFEKITTGPDKGACYHPCFVRGKPDLCHSMMRVKIKGANEPSKFTEATGSTLSQDSSSSISAQARPGETSSTSLLHYLTHPVSSAPSSITRPPMSMPMPMSMTSKQSSTPSVSEFIRSSAQGRGPEAAVISHEARLLHELRMRNDALEAALASRTATNVSALIAQAHPTFPSLSSSHEANLIHQRYLAQGLDQYPLLRRRDPVYEAALAAAVASKIVQL